MTMTTSDWTRRRHPVDHRRAPGSHARLAVTLVAATVVLLAGCGSSDRSARPPSTASSLAIAPTTTTKPDPTQAVLAAYQRYWQLWIEDNQPPNPDDPRLAEVETGAALASDREVIHQHAVAGEEFRTPAHSRSHHAAKATVVPEAGRATVIDCAIDDGVVVIASSGAIVNDAVETELWMADLVFVGGAVGR
jgi:hypothetical protein